MSTAVLIGWDPATPSPPPIWAHKMRGAIGQLRIKIDDISLYPPGYGVHLEVRQSLYFSKMSLREYLYKIKGSKKKCETYQVIIQKKDEGRGQYTL